MKWSVFCVFPIMKWSVFCVFHAMKWSVFCLFPTMFKWLFFCVFPSCGDSDTSFGIFPISFCIMFPMSEVTLLYHVPHERSDASVSCSPSAKWRSCIMFPMSEVMLLYHVPHERSDASVSCSPSAKWRFCIMFTISEVTLLWAYFPSAKWRFCIMFPVSEMTLLYHVPHQRSDASVSCFPHEVTSINLRVSQAEVVILACFPAYF